MTGGRFDTSTAAAIAIALLTIVLGLLVSTDHELKSLPGPAETELTRATLICPAGGRDVRLASASGVVGTLSVQTGGIAREVEVRPETPSPLTLGAKAAVVTGLDQLAPGLIAGRFDTPLSGVDCRPPEYDQWFTGVGAGAKHQSTLQLVNPDVGRAVVDVEVLGRNGPVDVPGLRGVTVKGGASRTFDLSTVIPRRDDLALHVRVLRGRVSASVRDSFGEIGATGQSGTDGLAAQDRPATSNLLLGLPAGAGQRTLVLANPGANEGRATVRLVSAESTFTPSGVNDVLLPPQSVVRVPLASVLRGAGDTKTDQPLGLQVESTVPTTAGLVVFVDGDLVLGVPVPTLIGAGATTLPDGEKQLLLGDATRQGVVTVELWDVDGRPLPRRRVEVNAGRGYAVNLPRAARLMSVSPERTPVAAVVLVTGNGATLVRVREPVTTGLVPAVGPGLP